MSRRITILVVFISSLLTACGPSDAAVKEAIQQTEAAQSRITEIVEQVVVERVVTATPEPTAATTPTAEIEPSPTACPEIDEDYSLYGVGFINEDTLLFTIENPELIFEEGYHIQAQGKKYSCELQSSYPNRLYCSGPKLQSELTVDFQLFKENEPCSLYAAEATIPEEPVDEDDRPSGGGRY